MMILSHGDTVGAEAEAGNTHKRVREGRENEELSKETNQESWEHHNSDVTFVPIAGPKEQKNKEDK